jgi:DNA mismatch repair protein MutS2
MDPAADKGAENKGENMDERVLKILEYDKILEKLAHRATSQLGKQLALQVRPQSDPEEARRLQQQTQEAKDLLIALGRSPVDAFPDVRASLKKCRATAALGNKELLEMARAMRASRLCKDALSRQEQAHLLNEMSYGLHACRSVEEEIERCIISDEEMADNASPRLNALRRQIKSSNDRVRDKLNSLLHSQTFKSALMEPIVTMRNGRYVVPVKAECRSQVNGLVHDQSGSGATLFIEPMAVVEIGNELKKLQSEEREEMERILSALTAMAAPESEGMLRALDMLAQLDVIFARAALAEAMDAVRPELNEEQVIRIQAGRHPLIDGKKVVPIDIWLGTGFKSLIITGPNTGGKTVTLKTVGLFCLMAQSGLFLPCMEGAQMGIFAEVFADIGDEQSIEQSLSTFSAHMTNVVSILERANDQCLILLDELGSGTDPIEGAALAMAILEELHDRRCTVLATTHYSELKAFALTHEGMENASMEFDVRTLRPTYRLFIGIPGKSNAFEISRRLGLEQRIIDEAQKHLDHKDIRFEDVISSAESQKRIAQEERRMAEDARSELYRLRDEAEKERRQLEEKREKLLKKAQEEARRIVDQARRESEGVIRELKSLKNSADEAERSRAIQKARDAMRESEKKLGSAHKQQEQRNLGQAPKTVQPGETVLIVTLDQKGTVLSAPDQKGEVQVQAGILKLNVKLKDLRLAQEGSKKAEKAAARAALAQKQVSMELDLRGMMSDEGVMEADRYIDDASLAGLHEVSIIHGKGTGALRAAIHDALRRNPHVKEFRLGRYGEGEAGVTVVTLK